MRCCLRCSEKLEEHLVLETETVTQTDPQDRVTRHSSVRDKFRFKPETEKRKTRGVEREFKPELTLV